MVLRLFFSPILSFLLTLESAVVRPRTVGIGGSFASKRLY